MVAKHFWDSLSQWPWLCCHITFLTVFKKKCQDQVTGSYLGFFPHKILLFYPFPWHTELPYIVPKTFTALLNDLNLMTQKVSGTFSTSRRSSTLNFTNTFMYPYSSRFVLHDILECLADLKQGGEKQRGIREGRAGKKLACTFILQVSH